MCKYIQISFFNSKRLNEYLHGNYEIEYQEEVQFVLSKFQKHILLDIRVLKKTHCFRFAQNRQGVKSGAEVLN